MEQFINIALWVSMIMVGVAALAAIILPLINSLSHPKTLIRSAIGIIGLVVLFFITWSIADGSASNAYVEAGVNESMSKFVGGSLLLMWALLVIAVVGVIFSEINKAIK